MDIRHPVLAHLRTGLRRANRFGHTGGLTPRRPPGLAGLLLFAQHLLRARNGAQQPGMATAVLRSVEVFSGQPSAEHDSAGYARRLAQKSHWERTGVWP
jgi:hypothetical protein